MWFPLIPLYISAITASSYGFWVQNAEPACPPEEEVKPCTCKISNQYDSEKVEIECRNINEVSPLKKAFSRSSNWNVQKIHFINCIIDYIPSDIASISTLETLNISRCNLVSMFDKTPVSTGNMSIYLYDSKFGRGMQWSHFRNTKIKYLGFFNVPFKNLGEQFKVNMPSSMKGLWFENSRTSYIIDNALERLQDLDSFTITGGSLRNCSRNWFPRPFNVKYLNLSNQKMTVLPKDLLHYMPKLVVFYCEKNLLTTVDKDVFVNSNVERIILTDNRIYCDCNVKWITTYKKDTSTTFWGACEEPNSFHGKDLYTLEPQQFNFCKNEI